jgi:3-oxoacyl-[acyl-carrier-protein] synthase III
MRFDPPLRIAAAALWLPDDSETVIDAARDGRIEPARATANGYVQLTVSDIPPPEMAVRAGAAALEEAGFGPEEVGLLVHAWTYYQGQDYWEPVHYILNELALYGAAPLGVSLGCNGGFAAVETAACRLLTGQARTALVTTAERFCPPRFDRWASNLDVCYGDSGTALLLQFTPNTGERGPFELLSTANVTDPHLEGMYRGSAPWNTVPFEHAETIDIRTQIRNFMAAGHGPAFGGVVTRSIQQTVRSALDQAALAADDPRIAVIAPPRFGAEVILHSYTEVLTGLTKAEIVNLGRGTGHLGAGDMAANLADIDAAGMLQPGQIALILSATAGFSWSGMVVRRS